MWRPLDLFYILLNVCKYVRHAVTIGRSFLCFETVRDMAAIHKLLEALKNGNNMKSD